MISDRDYMRPPPPDVPWFRRWSACAWLVLVNVVMYALQLAVPVVGSTDLRPGPQIEPWLALFPPHLLQGRIWELFTFQLLHASIFHLGINCLMLYVFGRPVEATIGRRSLLLLYFGSGAIGGLLQATVGLLFPRHFGIVPVIGASAGVFGLTAAFACLNPNLSITTLVAFLIPVSMRAIYLIPLQAVVAGLGMLDRGSNVAHAAHLGGLLAGVAYVRWLFPAMPGWWVKVAGLRRRRPEPELVRVVGPRQGGWARPPVRPQDDLPPAEFISREVDPVLDKISAHGIHSLTPRERRILELARDKMQKP